MHETFRIDPDVSEQSLSEQIAAACEQMEETYADGFYSKLTVYRHWSKHNPELSGKIARPRAYRWYLRRELLKLARRGAEITIARSRPRVDLNSPQLLEMIDETDFDLTRKKVFLFGPERSELSIKRLEHYTGTNAEDFQRYVLLTNYNMHIAAFIRQFPDCERSKRDDVQMPTLHHREPDNRGISIVNIGVGPSNAKNLTDHLAVLRPDAVLMVGHCAGVRNHQEIGDFVLASGYMRADHAQLFAQSRFGQRARRSGIALPDRCGLHDGGSQLGAFAAQGVGSFAGQPQHRRRHGIGHGRRQWFSISNSQRHAVVCLGQALARATQTARRGEGLL